MFYKRIIILCFLCFMLLSIGCTSKRIPDLEQVTQNEKMILKFSHVAAEGTPKAEAAKRFAELVYERTNGYVEVQVFPDSQLYKDGEEMEALKAGSVHFINPSTAKLSKLSPEWQVFDLPYLFSGEDAARNVMNGEIGKRMLDSLNMHGYIGLAIWNGGFKQITNDIRPVRKVSDMAGLSFRIMNNSKVLEHQYQTVGAKGVPLPYNEVYTHLAEYGLEGQENTGSNIYTKKYYSVQRYMTVTNHGFLSHVVLVNANFWKELPPEIRKVLEDTMRDVTEWEWEAAPEINKNGLEAVKSLNSINTHIQTESERREWINAFEPVYEQFSEEIGPDLIKSIKDYQLNAPIDNEFTREG